MITRQINLPDTRSFFLFGARQTGKSTLIKERFANGWQVSLLHSDTYMVYLKSPSQFRLDALYQIEKENIHVVIVDEIQRIPELLNEVHAILEIHPQIRFVLTGSSARKLRRAGVNLLGGRAVECRLFPFTHIEIGSEFDLEGALQYGTIPGFFELTEMEKQYGLSAYVNTYLREEIQSEGISRNLAGFSRFLDVAAAQCNEIVNYNSLGRECGLSATVIKNYYAILEDTLIGMKLEPWIRSVRKRLSAHPKFYLFDTGITNALQKRLTASPDSVHRGRLFEQFIITETNRLLSYSRSEAELFYWRTNNGAEVDLLIVKHGTINLAIEIKSSPNVSSADCSGLRSFGEEHPDVPKIVVGTVNTPFEIGAVTVLPWKEYFKRLSNWI